MAAPNPWDLNNDTLAYGEPLPASPGDDAPSPRRAYNQTAIFAAPISTEERAESGGFGSGHNQTLILGGQASSNPFDAPHNVTQRFGASGSGPAQVEQPVSTMPFRCTDIELPFDAD